MEAEETEYLVLLNPVAREVGTTPAQVADTPAPGTIFTKPKGAVVASQLGDGWSPGQQLLQMTISLL